jgi:hypothetical protein
VRSGRRPRRPGGHRSSACTGHRPAVDQRLTGAQLPGHERHQQNDRRACQEDDGLARPAPAAALRDRQKQVGHGRREQHGPQARRNVLPVRCRDSAATTRASHAARAARPPETQNSNRQFAYCTSNVDSGKPDDAPMPSDALITAVADASRGGGRWSRMRLMPSGTTPVATPCRARPIKQRCQRATQRRDHRTGDEGGKAPEQQAPLAPHVGKSPDDRCRYRACEQCGRDHPRGVGCRCASTFGEEVGRTADLPGGDRDPASKLGVDSRIK